MIQKLRGYLKEEMDTVASKMFSSAKERDEGYELFLTGLYNGFRIVEGMLDELEQKEN